MKTFTWRESEPPLRNLAVPSWSSVKRTPGARVARLRKFRLPCGSASICWGVILVAISEFFVSMRSWTASPTTVTFSVKTSPAPRTKSSSTF